MSAGVSLQAVLRGAEATEALGRRLGAVVEPGELIALDGELGSGKTTLVRGIAAGLGADPAAVRSPTFVLHHAYRGGRTVLHHVDLYRLGRGADLVPLDLESMLDEGCLAVEWAGLADLRVFTPVRIRLQAPRPDHRVVELEPGAPRRLRRALAP